MGNAWANGAAALCNDVLRQGDNALRVRDQLFRGMKERNLAFGDRLRSDVLRPRFIEEATHAHVQKGAVAVTQALSSIYDKVAHSPELRRAMGLPESAEMLLRLDGDTKVPSLVGRIDGMLNQEGQVRFIEYNPVPGAIVETDELADLFLDTDCMTELGKRYDCYTPSTREAMVESLQASMAQVTASHGIPRVAVVGPVAPTNQPSIDKLIGFLQMRGIAAHLVPADADWRFVHDTLFVGDFQVNMLVFPYVETAVAFIGRQGATHPAVEAIRAGRACIMNGLFRSAVLFSKRLFALLTDPEHVRLVDPALAAEAQTFVPWTRIVRPCMTSYQGKKIDLLPYISDHRKHFVLKPDWGFGGKGVVLGWECSSETWTVALKHAEDVPHVVQERVHTSMEPYPTIVGDELHFEQRYSDINPYVWSNRFASGYMVRTSKTGVLNLSAGEGSMTPAFVIRGTR